MLAHPGPGEGVPRRRPKRRGTILREIAGSVGAHIGSDRVKHTFVNLNDLSFAPCQACGESPEPDYCLYKDDIYPIYDYLINCDIILFGSPVMVIYSQL